MNTYTTLNGQTLSLDSLTPAERLYLERCVKAYHEGMAWQEFGNLVTGPENPLLIATKGRVTEAVWRHPLYQALRDLEDRLGITQGELEPDPVDNPQPDPFEDAWIHPTEAAARKGVTLMGLHGAIKRGEVIARPVKPGSKRLLVSANSLRAWQPNRVRQQARKRLAASA